MNSKVIMVTEHDVDEDGYSINNRVLGLFTQPDITIEDCINKSYIEPNDDDNIYNVKQLKPKHKELFRYRVQWEEGPYEYVVIVIGREVTLNEKWELEF